MADAVNQNENADELIKLGFDRLAAGDFNYATECFERSTTFEGKCYEAYWGLILSERLCRYRDGRDLIEKGFCIDKDLNYTLALIHADETSKETLYNVAKKCAFACHLKVLSLLDENKRRAAKLRADSYAKSSFAEESIVEAHKTLLKEEAFSDFGNEVPDTLLFLLAKYSGDDQYDYKQHNSVLVALYTKYMDKLLDAIITKEKFNNPKIENEFRELLKKRKEKGPFCEPGLDHRIATLAWTRDSYQYDIGMRKRLAETWTRPCREELSQLIGLDGNSGSVKMRWLYLAVYFASSEGFGKNLKYAEMTVSFYEKAISEGADKDSVKAEEQAYLEKLLQYVDQVEQAKMITELMPDCRKGCMKIIELESDCHVIVGNIDNDLDKYNENSLLFTGDIRFLNKYYFDAGSLLFEKISEIENKIKEYNKAFDEKELIIKENYAKIKSVTEEMNDTSFVPKPYNGLGWVRSTSLEELSEKLNQLKEIKAKYDKKYGKRFKR